MWGYESLEGRRTPEVSYYDLPPPPVKPAKGASAVEEARYKAALKTYNKAMRPAQGTALHAIFEAYYLQSTPGTWHPPMVWRTDLAELWHSRPGQIALSGRQHLPDPKSLGGVWVEELVSLDLSFLNGGTPAIGLPPRELLIGGTPDLVTLERGLTGTGDETRGWLRFHLYDYKSTISIDDYAKTEAELLEDEQAAIYSLAIMQKHGLSELACTWLYFQTDATKPARSQPVHFTMTRAHAASVVSRIAQQAAAMAETQARYLAEKPGMLGGRLKIIQGLATNDTACDNFGGCVFHAKRGGICTPRKSSFGEALNKMSAEKQKTTARREASKAAKAAQKERSGIDMNATQQARRAELLKEKAAIAPAKLNFAKAQELLKLEKLAAAEAEADAPEEIVEAIEAAGEDAPAEKPVQTTIAPASAGKPKAPSKTPAPVDASDFAEVRSGGTTVAIPKTSPLHKAIVKVCKAHEALASALAGE
jgi:hypothetical protein